MLTALCCRPIITDFRELHGMRFSTPRLACAHLASVLSLAVLASSVMAADASKIDIGQPTAITLEPGSFTLLGARSHQQLLVTGQYPNNEVRDLTAAASFTVSNAAAAKVEGSVVLPVANGDTQIIATVGSLTAAVNCSVKNMELPAPISFKNETLM